MSGAREFALLPAAGISARMGCCKLLLPCGDRLLIDRVLQHWVESLVARVTLVVRADNEELLSHLDRWDIDVVTPAVPPAEMIDSLMAGIASIAENWNPDPTDGLMIAPCDMPDLNPAIIDRVALSGRGINRIVIPTLNGKRGHPIRLPWDVHRDVLGLGPGKSLRDVLAFHDPVHLPMHDPGIRLDLDNPEQFDQWRRLGSDKSG